MHEIVTYKTVEGYLVCSFAGRLDTGVTDMIEDDLIDHIMIAGLPVKFDFQNVEFVSSPFLRISIKAARVAPGMEIIIVNALSVIKEVYDMTGLSKMFRFEDVRK
ncbi:MAG: STAS domain-containing protein [Victivallales bacterium]|nr:STAS domain-containing protein [Victivallales bacterium]